MRRPSSVLALALLLACGGRGPGGPPAGSSSARPQALPALPSRAEVVALSDQWALDASKKPGRDGAALYERAARELDLELTASWWVGDRERDLAAADRYGGRALLVLTGAVPGSPGEASPRPRPTVSDLAAAVARILDARA
jgi:hypothetical protein